MMDKRTLALFLLIISSIILLTGIASAIPEDDDCSHLSDESPTEGAEDVPITDKGVQTCINVTVPDGCTLNITFMWFDYNGFFDAWADYNDGIAPLPNYYDYEHNYSQWTNINISQRLCAWNDNVTCYTEGAYPYFAWGVLTEYNCSQSREDSFCMYTFYPEECDLFYIEPTNNATNLCPCCVSMCTGINNADGHNMNFTVYAKSNQMNNYEIIKTKNNVSNGTYCWCLDSFEIEPHAVGHTEATITPAAIDTWYNISFQNIHSEGFTGTPSEMIIPYDTYYTFDYWLSCETQSAAPAGDILASRMTVNGAEVNSTYRELNFQKQDNLRQVVGMGHSQFQKGDRLNFQFIVNNINIEIKEDNTYSVHNTSAYASVKTVLPVKIPLSYNTSYSWYVNVTDTVTGDSVESDIFHFKTYPNTSYCPCGEEELTDVITNVSEDTDTIKDDSWLIGIIIPFSIFGIIAYIRTNRKRKN